MPCCQKCSCEPDCQLFGNCCPDKELTPDVQVKYPCIQLDQYHNEPRNIIPFKIQNAYYHVINDCPTKHQSARYPRCSELRYLEDYAFVSDPLTGRVYQNKHCARCNGVMDYTVWYLSTDCTYGNKGFTWEEWSSYLLTSCQITPIPPAYSSGNTSRCYGSKREDIRECNFTGKWKTVDKAIQNACEYENPAINDMYYHDVTHVGTVIFQNPFCKLCNAKDDEDWSDLCKQLLPPFKAEKIDGKRIIVRLIDFVRDEETVVEASPRCSQLEVWDPFQESCITVTCPTPLVHLAGKCQDIYERYPEETYAIYFKIESNLTYISYYEIVNVHETITNIIPNEHCYRCGTRPYIAENNVLYIRYDIKTQDGCSEDYLVRQVKLMIDSPPVSNGYNTLVRLVPDIRTPWIEFIPNGDGFRYDQNGTCWFPIQVNEAFIDRCPRVSIEHFKFNVTVHDGLDFRSKNNGTICVDDYFRIMQSLNRSDFVKQNHLVTVFVTIASYCIIQ
ncbi:hypothetical protein ACF0H5_021955 [Mactra antiquata]